MQVILEAIGLWEMIEPKLTTEADTKKDKTAIAYIYQSLPEEQLLLISKYKTEKEVWNALKKRHVGENPVQQAKQQTLKSEFEMLQMEDIYVARTPIGRQSVGSITNQKHDQSGFMIDHNNKVEVTESNDQPGLKEDHNFKGGTNQKN
nr:zinc finger, CCHC-type [Tanacetum cinerariifolium]